MAARLPPSWIFKFLKFLTVGWLKSAELRRRAEFGRNRSNRGRDMVIFRFFKMAAAAILDFSNFKFLTVGRLKRAELRRRAKFGRNQSNRYRDMTIFAIFLRWRPSAILDLLCVFGPPTKGIWWSLLLCKIWLESVQWFR